jgi:hypothetical protein
MSDVYNRSESSRTTSRLQCTKRASVADARAVQ